MSVTIRLRCSGCEKIHETPPLRRVWEPFTRTLSKVSWPHLADHVPEGWQMFDPYTGACYCRECWEDILAAKEEVS